MYLTVFVEPGSAGFRATCTSPLALTADGPTADAAVAAVREQYAVRLAAGGEVRTVSLDEAAADRPGSAAAILAAVADRCTTPLSDEFDREVAEFHRLNNTVPDDDPPS